MSFRRNHLGLLKGSSYNIADLTLSKLVEDLHNFYFVVRANRLVIDTDMEYFHRSKFYMSDNIIEAHKLYEEYKTLNDERLLGQIAIKFDSVISICHKILIQYYPKGKKFTNANTV